MLNTFPLSPYNAIVDIAKAAADLLVSLERCELDSQENKTAIERELERTPPAFRDELRLVLAGLIERGRVWEDLDSAEQDLIIYLSE
jgi:hypothetical protein